MTATLVFAFVLGLFAATACVIAAGDDASAGSKKPKELKPASNVTMKRIKVALSKTKLDTERYCHRAESALKEEQLKPLMDSLILEGMQVPIEGYFDEAGNFVVVKGNCRVTSHLILVRKNTPGFTADMELEAIELDNYTPQDLLVRSIADNEVRKNLDRTGRVKAAKKLYDAGVEEGRAAAALGVSVKTYQRDLLIAKYGWMFEHVIDGSIEPTNGSDLLEAAEKYQRVAQLREDLDAWIAEQKKALRQKEKIRKLNGGKDLSPAEKQVKKQMPNHLVKHWLDLIKQGKRFDEDSEWDFSARIDKEKRRLEIGSVNADLDKDPPEKIAKIASKLSLLTKQLMPYVQQRLATMDTTDKDEQPIYDLEYLKSLGGEKLAEHLQERIDKAKAEAKDGVDELQPAPEERAETDLTNEIELPESTDERADVTAEQATPAKDADNDKDAE